MNSETKCCDCRSKAAYFFAVLGAFLIVAALVWAMKKYTTPEPVNAGRAAERAKALVELRAAEADALNNTGWIDQSKGIVRLKIDDAMKLVIRNWQNPAAGRKDLIAREEKATYVPPPPPPKPSAFE
jgi:uncharacterized protein YdaU (DUF1376 family)